MASLKHKLINGDIVEILTSQQAHPTRDWLKFVVTSKARTKITNFLHQQERSHALAVGRQMLERALDKHERAPANAMEEKPLSLAAKASGYAEGEAMLVALGLGKAKLSHVLQKMLPKESAEDLDRKVESIVPRVTHPKKTSRTGVRVSGVEGVMIRIARCCSPAHGEPIIGFISRGRGVMIHAAKCENALNMGLDSERRVDVEWDMETAVKTPVTLLVESENRPGILASVSSAISDHGANIIEAAINSTPGELTGSLTLTVEVNNIAQLNHILTIISRQTGVLAVERIRDRNVLRQHNPRAKSRKK